MNLKKQHNETDGPWQEVLERFFQPFVELCFPTWVKQIDWNIPYKVLKGEFPSDLGKQICDMLFEIQIKNGEKRLVQLYFEIQGQRQKDFSFRMLDYNMTIYRKHRKPVISTAVFLDDDLSWRPNSFQQDDPFTGKPYHQFSFNALKIADYKGKEEILKKEKNIFALVILAQLAIMEAGENQELRRRHKLALAKKLFNSGYNKEDVSNLYKFIDWLIKLTSENMKTFEKEIVDIAGRESWMDWDPVYVSTFEQVGMMRGMEKGIEKGRLEALRNLLDRQIRRRFPQEVTAKHLYLIAEADDKTLSNWGEKLIEASTLEEVFFCRL